jgi:riboflavin kinase / FMN adenylyltransferase
MEHYRWLDNLDIKDSWVTVGSFDGVHRGHQALIREMVTAAHAAHQKAVVVTFFPHPAVVLRGLKNPFYLTSPEERARLMGELGVDVVVTLEFTLVLSSLSAFNFMDLLCRHLNVQQLWVGFNFALGKNRQGDILELEKIGTQLGYSIHVVSPVFAEGEAVSSSLVRKALGNGDVDLASQYLGRWFMIIVVIEKFTSISIPGADRPLIVADTTTWSEQMIPPPGCYAAWVEAGSRSIPSVVEVFAVLPDEGQKKPPRIQVCIKAAPELKRGEMIKLKFADKLPPQMSETEIDMTIMAMNDAS